MKYFVKPLAHIKEIESLELANNRHMFFGIQSKK